MSIAFNKNIADEETVYQSLHKLFLVILRWLYMDIAIGNYGEQQGPDKLYTGCIELYNKWNRRQRTKAFEWENAISEKIKEQEKLLRRGTLQTPPLP